MTQTLPPVRIPSRFVPITALATGEPGALPRAVSTQDPLPTAAAPFGGARAVVADIATVPGRAILLDCSTAGTVALELADGSPLAIRLSAGVTILPLAVRAIASSGTTASLAAWVLD